MTTDRTRPRLSKRAIVLSAIFLLPLLLVICGGLGIYAVRQARWQRNSASPLIGTWQGEAGNRLNFRADGTARWRSSDDPTIGYLEWTLDESNELTYYQFSSRNSFASWFGRTQRATVGIPPTERCVVVELSPTELKLRTSDGEVHTFTNVVDRELETAP